MPWLLGSAFAVYTLQFYTVMVWLPTYLLETRGMGATASSLLTALYILANAAAAAGMECSVFFTFYGLNILKKDFGRTVRVGPTGNPAMPMPIPMPQLLTVIPGMVPGATWMMKQKFKKKNVADIEELRSLAIESGVKLIGCTMTMDVFGYTDDDFIDGVEYGGAAAFLSEARKANVTLFI